MRSLILFIWKHHFFFLFLLLECICFYFIFKHNYYQRAAFVHSANKVSGSIFNAQSAITEYFHLKEDNLLLVEENARLRSLSKSSYLPFSQRSQVVNDTIYRQKYEYISAKVVNNSTNRRNNYLTLDRGSSLGVKPDMAVISSKGVVGIVANVSENFSSVMSLLHKDTRISAKIKKDGSFGPLFWEGEDYRYATLTDIPTHVPLLKGDTIVTSAYSLTFPEGILIGTVESFEIRSGSPFYTVKVNLSTDFKKVSYVYVINNIMKEEQENLENTAQHD